MFLCRHLLIFTTQQPHRTFWRVVNSAEWPWVWENGGESGIVVEVSLQIMKRTRNSVSTQYLPLILDLLLPLNPNFLPPFSLIPVLSCTYTLLSLAGKESVSSMQRPVVCRTRTLVLITVSQSKPLSSEYRFEKAQIYAQQQETTVCVRFLRVKQMASERKSLNKAWLSYFENKEEFPF